MIKIIAELTVRCIVSDCSIFDNNLANLRLTCELFRDIIDDRSINATFIFSNIDHWRRGRKDKKHYPDDAKRIIYDNLPILPELAKIIIFNPSPNSISKISSNREEDLILSLFNDILTCVLKKCCKIIIFYQGTLIMYISGCLVIVNPDGKKTNLLIDEIDKIYNFTFCTARDYSGLRGKIKPSIDNLITNVSIPMLRYRSVTMDYSQYAPSLINKYYPNVSLYSYHS